MKVEKKVKLMIYDITGIVPEELKVNYTFNELEIKKVDIVIILEDIKNYYGLEINGINTESTISDLIEKIYEMY